MAINCAQINAEGTAYLNQQVNIGGTTRGSHHWSGLGSGSSTVSSGAPAYKIRKLEDALHDKKAEICKLRENIKELEQVLIITHDELKDAQNKIELLQETIGGYQS